MTFLYILIALAIICLILLIICLNVHHKIFGKRFEKDPDVTYFMPEDFNIQREEIEIKNKKITLRGYRYNKLEATKKPLVVFAHGMWSNVDAYNQDICYYCKHGYEVIAINHEGVSTSDGKNIKGLGNAVKSLDITLNYIEQNEEFKDREIYLVGHSWGAYSVLCVTKFHPHVKKIVAISPFASPSRLYKGMLPKYAFILIPFMNLIEKFKFGKYGNEKVYNSIIDFEGNVFILHSKDDHMVNYKYNTEYLEDHLPQVNYYICDKKQHNPNYSLEAVKYMNEYNKELKQLSKEDAIKFKKHANFAKMGELDDNVMQGIVNFLDK